VDKPSDEYIVDGDNMADNSMIYKNPEGKAKCLAIYDSALAHWPVPYEQLDLPTRFGRTHVVVSGPQDAPPLILLHGNWATAMMWSSAISELSHDRCVYALDQIDDVGKSSPTRLPASRSDYAAWLMDVFDQLELQQADIVGLSYGGFLAVNFALSAPDQVKRLILLCPGIPNFGPPTRRYAIHGLPLILFPSRLTGKWLIQGLSVRGYHSNDLETEQLIVSAMNLRSRIPFRPVFSDDEFKNLTLPILLLIGDKEVLYDAKSAIERVWQLIPNVESEIINNAGHMLTTDQPAVVISRVLQFLQSEDPIVQTDLNHSTIIKETL
jgi:pimeloyl-ACP methyl ester carboxylesterase